MTKQEFAVLASAIRTYYPKEKILPNQQAMQLWFIHLQDIPYRVAEVALEKWVISNKWSPTIADLREYVKKVYWQAMDGKEGVELFDLYDSLKKMERNEERVNNEQIQDTLAYKTVLQARIDGLPEE